MKISKRQLKRIIREEKRRLQESEDIYPRPQHPMIANAGANLRKEQEECVRNILMINSDSITDEEASLTAADIIDALREEGLI